MDADNTLTGIHNIFEQDGRSFNFSTCQAANAQWTGGDTVEYLRRMTANLKQGMVMDISLWGVSNAGMSWLDGPTKCKGDCNVSNSSAHFSDLSLQPL
jgi:hypothetical protein